MSNDKIAVQLTEREVVRKGLSKLRAKGTVPVVVHNHGKESIHAQGDFVALTKVFHQAGKHHPVELKIGDKQKLALIKDIDFEPTKHRIRHIVFQAIKQDEKTTAEVPLVLVGDEIPAERQGLLVLPQLDVIQVEALPRDLPDQLTVDATKLVADGDHLHVSDIKVPAGVTILTDPDTSVAVVETPRDQLAEADAAAQSLADDAGIPEESETVEEPKTDSDEPTEEA